MLEATSGAQALELIRAEPPDAVLLDVTMPEMSGFEVYKAIRREPKLQALPVLLGPSSADGTRFAPRLWRVHTGR